MGTKMVWIVKLDSNGKEQWQTVLGGSGDDEAMDMRQTLDGGYIVTGFSDSNDIKNTKANNGKTDVWVIKLDSAGAVQWQELLGGSEDDFGSSIVQNPDGSYVLVGYTDSDNSGDVGENHGYYDIWVAKLDSTGVPLWKKLLGGNNFEITAFGNALQRTSDGGYVLIGTTGSFASGNVSMNHGSADVWVVKLDDTGNIQWENSYGGTGYDDGISIQQTSDGQYIFSGRTLSSNSGNVADTNHGDWDIWVGKLDTAGNLLWQSVLGGSKYEQGNSIRPTTDGGFILAGHTLSGNSGDVVGKNQGYEDAWIVKLKPRILIDVTDSDLRTYIPNAVVSITDLAHSEDESLISSNGPVIFNGTGTSDEYSFIKGNNYQLTVSSAGYHPFSKNITFNHDGKREAVKLNSIQ